MSFTRSGNDRWWAAGSCGGRGLLLECRGLPAAAVGLVRVVDLEPDLSGSRRWLAGVRGGY